MKQLQNVLYVMTEDSYLHKEGEAVSIRIGGEERVRIPAHTLESVVCFGNITVSTPLIGFLGERGVGLTFLSVYGRFLGRVEGPVRGNVLLRRAQHEHVRDGEKAASLARAFVLSKLANSRNVLLRAAREGNDEARAESLRSAAREMGEIAQQVAGEGVVDSIRGLEGAAASIYWRVFDHLIRASKRDFFFRTRSRRPPEDRVNAMLSFAYSLLANDVRSALEAVGLDPAMGFLHALRPGRPALALDVMEELRAWMCDRMVVSLVNLQQLRANDFDMTPTGVNMKDGARRTFLDAWQKRKREEIVHPFTEASIPIGLVPFVQAQLLARYLRGDLDLYPPFLWK